MATSAKNTREREYSGAAPSRMPCPFDLSDQKRCHSENRGFPLFSFYLRFLAFSKINFHSNKKDAEFRFTDNFKGLDISVTFFIIFNFVIDK